MFFEYTLVENFTRKAQKLTLGLEILENATEKNSSLLNFSPLFRFLGPKSALKQH
jgi:hypothetical protein